MNNIFRRFLAGITDLIFIILFYSLMFNLCFVIFYEKLPFLIFVFVYYSISIFFEGKTLGKSFFKLQIDLPENKQRKTIFLFIRELILKYGVFTLLPCLILNKLKINEYLAFIAVIVTVAFVNLIVYAFSKKFIWDIILKTNISFEKNRTKTIKLFSFKYLLSLIIDASIVIPISLFFFLFLQKWVFIDFNLIILLCAAIYFFVCYYVAGSTPGKKLFGFVLEFHDKTSKINTLMIREVVKFAPVLILFFLLKILRFEFVFYNQIFIIVIFLYIFLFAEYSGKGTWWNGWAKTKKAKGLPIVSQIVLIVSVLLFYLFSFVGIKSLNNAYPCYTKYAGFHYYLYNKHYPYNDHLKTKTDFIKNQNTSPKEYIFNLFEKYDIVILGETGHEEMTQWELFYDIVSDERFISNVGHVFTEFGSNEHQYLSDEYFTTQYESETELKKATINLLRYEGVIEFWSCQNIFEFFKKVNLLNQTLPDSLKIKEYFTDVYAFGEGVKNTEDYTKKILKRDSMMANTVIKRFEDIQKESNRKKCLVIMNYRHSFNYSNLQPVEKLRDATSYIFHHFPHITANVLIHRHAIKFPLLDEPINKSTWDKAFDLCENKPVGFDFKGTPFGNDYFDLFMGWGRRDTITFKDIYTGYIFYKPLSEYWFQTGIPNAFDDFEDEYKRRFLLRRGSLAYVEQVMESIEDTRINYANDSSYILHYIYNNIEVTIYLIFFLLGNAVVVFILLYTVLLLIRNRFLTIRD